jgi:hypothetical protein
MARLSAMSAAVRILVAVSVVLAAETGVVPIGPDPPLQPIATAALAAPRLNMLAPTRKERRLTGPSINCCGIPGIFICNLLRAS